MHPAAIGLVIIISTSSCLCTLVQESADNTGSSMDDTALCSSFCSAEVPKEDKSNLQPKPCDNFYKHVCGNKQPLQTEDAGEEIQETYLQKELVKKIKDILEAKPNDEGKKESPTSEIDNSLDIKKIAKGVYGACKQDEKSRTPRSLRDGVLKILSSFQLNNWPVCTGEHGITKKETLKRTGLRPVATVAVVGNEAQQQYTLSVTIPWARFAPYPQMFVNRETDPAKLTLYRSFMRSVLRLMISRGESSGLDPTDEEKCDKDSNQSTDNDPNDNIRKAVGDIIEVELALAEMAVRAQKAAAHTVRATIKEWQNELGDELPVFKALQADFLRANITLEETDNIIVQVPEYFKLLASYLKKLRARKLYNYVGWYFVREIADGLNCDIRKKLNEFLEKTPKPGIPVQLDADTCVKKLIGYDGLMDKGITFMYLTKYFTETSIAQATKVAKDIGKTFSQFITRNSWLGSETKSKMSTWMTSLEYHIGASEASLNELMVQKSYNLVLLSDSFSLPQYFWALRQNNYLQKLTLMKTGYEKNKIWPVSPLQTSSTYEEHFTSLEMPAGALQSPIYKEPASTSHTYGSMGSLAAEVMTRGFTSEGHVWTQHHGKYDWKREDKKKLKELLRCLKISKDQGNQGRLKNKNQQDDFEARGDQTTLGLKLYDHVALRTSFFAFRDLLSKCVEKCPQFNTDDAKTNHLRDFFQAYAERHCEANGHGEAEYRVNFALRTFEKFAKAFQCKTPERMKGPDNCKIFPRTLDAGDSDTGDQNP
ncbi:phosphate-regulating neutral endopeptidase PHEX-like [Dermacentor variabilis]|uniref:phosphate-regulating neutral endopeptidase PHEX-like n=1 Tax=Dermacentor variabilis TaxID=34621 RepID=UPI003F5C9EC5